MGCASVETLDRKELLSPSAQNVSGLERLWMARKANPSVRSELRQAVIVCLVGLV